MLPINEPSAIWVAAAHGLAAEDLDAVIDGLIAEFAKELQDAVVIEHVVLACHSCPRAASRLVLSPRPSRWHAHGYERSPDGEAPREPP